MGLDLARCPNCRAPHDGVLAADGHAHCPICAHQWNPTPAAGVSSLRAPSEALTLPISGRLRPVAPAAPEQAVSDEYFPAESGQRRVPAPPLTDRADKAPVAPIAEPAASPQRSAPTAPLPPRPRREIMETDPFERQEAAIAAARSEQHTVVDRQFAAAASSDEQRQHCPMCGHGFWPLPGSSQSCPQCGATFDIGGSMTHLAAGDAAKHPKGDLFIGRTIRGCLLDRKLGEGAMGTVYHARQLSLERSVAIKLLPAELARNRGFISRFEREAKTLAAINHPNILHIYDFGEDQSLSVYFMIIEYVDGVDLGALLDRQQRFSVLETLDMLRQSCYGLEMAAHKGIIHRDIKPDNLLLANDGTWKVADFGLAKGIAAEKEVTTTGVRVGTPAFMSPEQCDGVEVDVRSDIYNLGVTAFLAVTGQLPFDAETPFAIMLKHKQDPIPSLLRYDATIQPEFDDLIQRMLAKRPDDRCMTVRELIDAIESTMVKISGSANILRKSRGPFRALRDRGSVKPAKRPPSPPPAGAASNSPAAAAASKAERSSESSELDWLRPIELQPDAHPSSAAPVAAAEAQAKRTPALGTNAPVGDSSSGFLPPRKQAQDSVPLRVRSLRARADALASAADRHASAGNLIAAAAEWREAAQLTPDPEHASELLALATRHEAWQRKKRLMVRAAVLAASLAVVVAGVRWVTPEVHNMVAQREVDAAMERQDPTSRLQGLTQAIDANNGAWTWWTAVFRTPYTLPAIVEAQRIRDDLRHAIERSRSVQLPSATKATNTTGSGGAAVMPGVEINPQASLASELARVDRELREATRAEHIVALRAQRDVLMNRVRSASQAQAAITLAMTSGHHDQALLLAERYRTEHAQASAADIPLPLSLRLRGQQGDIDMGMATVVIDGVTLSPSSVAQGRIAVLPQGGAHLKILVPGYETAALMLSQPQPNGILDIRLSTAAWWSAQVGSPEIRNRWARIYALPGQPGSSLVVRADGWAVVDLTAGTVTAQRACSELAMPWATVSRSSIDVAQSGGSIERLSPTLTVESTLLRGVPMPRAIIAHDMTLRLGIRQQVVIGGEARPELIGLENSKETWRYGPLQVTQQPLLFGRDDRMVVIDDVAIHSLNENGGDAASRRVTALPAERIGPVLELDQSWLVIPTSGGVLLARFNAAASAAELSDLAPVGQVGSSTSGLVVHAQSGAVQWLTRQGTTLSKRWEASAETGPACSPAANGAVLAVAGTNRTITVFRVSDGMVLKRITRPTPAAALQIAADGRVIVVEQSGLISAH